MIREEFLLKSSSYFFEVKSNIRKFVEEIVLKIDGYRVFRMGRRLGSFGFLILFILGIFIMSF